MIKVAIDFDDTLDQIEVQKFVTDLLERGDIEIWICTARMDNEWGNPNWNTDMFMLASKLRIPIPNIIMTNGSPKSHFLHGKGFLFLLDDMDSNMVDLLKSDCIPILYAPYNNWREKCLRLINNVKSSI